MLPMLRRSAFVRIRIPGTGKNYDTGTRSCRLRRRRVIIVLLRLL